jgi:erythromycin esterase
MRTLRERWAARGGEGVEELASECRRMARPLKTPADLDPLMEQIGDGRATDMAGSGMENVGQLVRERHSRDGVVLAGFGSSRGSVIAGREWGAPMERMPVPEAREGSWENILHKSGAGDKLLLLSPDDGNREFLEPRGHRAIGVVYDPAYEHWGNYVPTVLPLRYDAFLYIDETRAVHPLHIQPREGAEPPETYPWNV